MLLIQILFFSLFLIPIIWLIINYIQQRNQTSTQIKGIVPTLLNSAILYALAFNLIFFIQELFLVLGKKALGLTSTLYHNNHTWEGDHPMASLMQGTGALAIFVTGIVCLLAYRLMANSRSIWRLFALWLSFQGLFQSIPQVVIAYMAPETDVGDALIGYLNLSQPLLIILALVSIIALPLLANWFSNQLLSFISDGIDYPNPKTRLKYVGYIAFGSGLLGSILTIPFRILPITQIIAPFMVFAISLPWVWASAILAKNPRPTSNRISKELYWSPLILLILLLAFFQMVLAPGITV